MDGIGDSVARSRVDLATRIAELERQLAAARRELAALDKQPEPQNEALEAQPIPSVTAQSSSTEKIALFMDRFAGRSDVYATRWVSGRTGKSGWSPAVRGGFYTDTVTAADFLPFTAQVIDAHLRTGGNAAREFHVGIYPMLSGDLCRLLVCDFDDGEWKNEAGAYAQACADAGVDTLTEISRSGEGAHVWMFFTEAVPAAVARAAGIALLNRAMRLSASISFASYDRFFPAQDVLPTQSTGRARLGNLIALPLQGDCRRRGAAVFADPRSWVPYADQFAALATTARVSRETLTELARAGAATRVGPAETLAPRPKRATLRKGRRERAGQGITLRRDAVIHIPVETLPGSLITELKHLASVANPEFFRRQAQRLSTYGTPRYVTCFEDDGEELRIPQGLLEEATLRIEEAGFTVRATRPKRKKHPIDLAFTGELRPGQVESVQALMPHESGVLVAPPGSGKTVIACALIAERNVPTAILVNRAELVVQWRERVQQFLDIQEKQIGQLGAGRRKRKGVVDLVMMQSLAHRDGDPTILSEYGQVIIDECHAVAGPAIEAALRQADVPYWVGLTATPYRSDQLDGLITMQCGPIRHLMRGEDHARRLLCVHETSFVTHETGTDGPAIQAMYTELAHDAARNTQIVNEITAAAGEGRRCLVLTNRVDHLELLATQVRAGIETAVLVLHGRLAAPERRAVRARLGELVAQGAPFVLLAIDKIAGEGLDLPTLDTLFLAVPISFKGKVVQQLGRITRGSGSSSASASVVHDFHDAQVPLFDRMFARRARVMQREGFVRGDAGLPV